MGRYSFADCHVPIAVSKARASRARWASSATEDHDQHDGDRQRRLAGAVERRLVDDADPHAGHDAQRQAVHPGDHRGGQAVEQDRRADRAAQGEAHHRSPEEHRHRGQHGGDDPHDRRHPTDRDAEQSGPLAVLGRRPHRDAHVREAEERAERRADHCGHHAGHDEVAGEPQRVDVETEPGERRPEVAAAHQLAGDRGLGLELEHQQEQRDADRRDGHDEAGCVLEATDEDDLHERAEQRAPDEHDGEDDEVVHVLAQDQQEGHHGRHRAQLRLGEVDDAVGPVDEDQAHPEQAVEQPDGGTVQEDRTGHRPVAKPEVDGSEAESAEQDLDQHLDDHDVARRPASAAVLRPGAARIARTACFTRTSPAR